MSPDHRYLRLSEHHAPNTSPHTTPASPPALTHGLKFEGSRPSAAFRSRSLDDAKTQPLHAAIAATDASPPSVPPETGSLTPSPKDYANRSESTGPESAPDQ